jgi:hypothetical protein
MKRSVMLLAVLIVLLGIYWLVQTKKPVVEANRPFVEVDSAKVATLAIRASGESIELTKNGDLWTMTKPVSFPAASKTIQSAVGRLKDMKRLVLITEQTNRFREYQVDDSAGVRIAVSDGKKSTVFYLGKASSTGNSYARLDGSNQVWEVSGNPTGSFKRRAKDWRDKTINELNQSDFRKLNFRYPGTSEGMIATLVDTVWKIDNGKQQFTAAKGQVERVTGLLAHMSAMDFADSLAPSAFDRPEFEMIADLNNGTSFDLKLMPRDEDANQYNLRKAGAPTDFVIYKSTANVLMKKPDDFKEKPEGEVAAPKAKAKGKKA